MAKVQATDVSYELHSLGWKAFQDLCLTTISDVLGQTVQSFLSSRDGGRDGAFHGTWDPGSGAGCEGSFTVQCKFSTKAANLTLAGISPELEKAERLSARGLTDNYILMTNLGVSGSAEAEIRQAFLEIENLQHFFLFGRDWMTQKIRESARLRMLVPRIYGLGDLSQILDERAYAQALEILSALGDDLSKLVVTQPHVFAARALVNHGFVLLLGEPAAGKSTIAASLAVGALDLWECSTLKIRNADDFVRHWNPKEKQFFWVDDAFGATQYQRNLAHEWSQVFPHMGAAVRRGTRVLFTSRDYIYRAARFDLKSGAFPLINESQVVIDVQRLSPAEKQQILYNHVRLGGQPRSFRTRIKSFLPDVAANRHFLPEIARRLGSPLFTKGLSFDEPSVRRFVEKPIRFLVEVVSNLDSQSRAALALIFMRGGALDSPVELSPREHRALQILGADLRAALDALVALNSSLVSLVHSGGNSYWTFKHPTIGDAYASIVADDPELLDIYMSWTSAEKLISEVTCGPVDLQGVKVIVPRNRFDVFLSRLSEVGSRDKLHTFLATRCSRSFLKLYIEQHPELGDSICEPGSYLSAVSAVDVLEKLYRGEMLPEEWRCRFVEHARSLALETPDVDFLSLSRIRALFREEEISEILDEIRNELLPSFSDVVSNWRYNCDSERDPEDEFAALVEVLDTLDSEFAGEPVAKSQIASARREIDEVILELQEENPIRDEDRSYDYERPSGGGFAADRDIFDDVDE